VDDSRSASRAGETRREGFERSGHSAEGFRLLVAEALAAIAGGDLEKVVLARSERLRSERPLAVAELLRRLRAAHPGCTLFAVARGGVTWAGATPERLVRVVGRQVEAEVVAGSAPRGASPRADHELARALLESKKDQEEHAVVRRAVCSALAAVCQKVEAAESPALFRTRGIQHLRTPVRGRLRAATPAAPLELVEALHPTPAVCGAPRQAALDWIARREGLQRGWYAGPLGWLDDVGNGEFAVGLRGALLGGREALLFAGAGVVRGSRPEAELAETEWKLASVRELLRESPRRHSSGNGRP